MHQILILFLILDIPFSTSTSPLPIHNLKIPETELGINATCPWNFTLLKNLITNTKRPLPFNDVVTQCNYMLPGLLLLRSEYLRTTGYFFPPSNSIDSCIDMFESLAFELIPGFSMEAACGLKASMISEICLNITNLSQFVSLVSETKKKNGVFNSCNQSLKDNSRCVSCTDSLSRVYKPLFGVYTGNVSDCSVYPYIYAGGLVNRFGPGDPDTAKCLFSLDFTVEHGGKRRMKNPVLTAVVFGSVLGLLGTVLSVWFIWRRRNRRRRKTERRRQVAGVEGGLKKEAGTETETKTKFTTGGDGSLIKFTFDEIKKSTKNFSRDNIIGMGGYGNVYKGTLENGVEVALKRFKNCSASGDASFEHELEVIASVKHVNLVDLIGYCAETVPMEAHQRIIVCELMRNGSLHDNLFGSSTTKKKKLTWPTRKKIVHGTAKGLAYLHYGAQTAIIHRDVKASNILLDDAFDPKLADFGLAKFTPEGLSHLSTKVAGTLGYVAPEYALYGQLTERNDVYSFGVVLLELLSGKKAVISMDDDQGALLLTDWAWSLVKEGRAFDVVDANVMELDSTEVMEKYVLVAVLCSHPVSFARPMMDQVVKILEADDPVPSIADINDMSGRVGSYRLESKD